MVENFPTLGDAVGYLNGGHVASDHCSGDAIQNLISAIGTAEVQEIKLVPSESEVYESEEDRLDLRPTDTIRGLIYAIGDGYKPLDIFPASKKEECIQQLKTALLLEPVGYFGEIRSHRKNNGFGTVFVKMERTFDTVEITQYNANKKDWEFYS